MVDIPTRAGPSFTEHMTRRQYLTYEMLCAGADIFTAIEAVSSTAIEHPEWDLDEVKSLSEWEVGEGGEENG